MNRRPVLERDPWLPDTDEISLLCLEYLQLWALESPTPGSRAEVMDFSVPSWIRSLRTHLGTSKDPTSTHSHECLAWNGFRKGSTTTKPYTRDRARYAIFDGSMAVN